MRIRESPEQVQFMKMASEQGQLDQVFAALDVLGRTPWKINKPVFDIVMQVWNSGEAFADIPINNAETKIPDPKPPSAEQLRDPRDREAYRVQLKQVRNARSTAHSQRCDLNYKLEIAKAVSFALWSPCEHQMTLTSHCPLHYAAVSQRDLLLPTQC